MDVVKRLGVRIELHCSIIYNAYIRKLPECDSDSFW